MRLKDFSKEDYWRTIILYGLNQATYKIALGQPIIHDDKVYVSCTDGYVYALKFF
ncbi:PQQ-binding-like beta-propeller repeat protein [Fictibacillus sp. KU28468]|uniref:PQQ-binding-like beta-propeller repeat protein n=1 Tax=Fictibacillus sp. KU28468 TaxID=2991053 RepID=UPI00223D1597|nr:PQQ-binding-like beta-propeller repeat protein [Fictibacillus sp. KU28468]UZJ78758.1 PQQ-binding-like beta-propeller repeat protein [Fictibacillus sp. KU28468]